MLRCLHLADLHLGWSPSFLGDKAEEYARWRDGMLQRLTEWIVDPQQQLDLILIVGDLFETHRPAAALVEQTIAALEAWEKAGITVITVPGNHDEITYHDSVYQRYGQRWPGYLVTNPMPQPPRELTINGEKLYLYSLAYTGGLTKVADYVEPYPRVGAEGIHLAAFHGSLDWQTGERGLPLSAAQLAAAGYDYVALGHFHRPQQLERNGTVIAYAGAIASKGFSDIGCGQLTVATLQPGQVQVERIPWQAVDHRVVSIDVSHLDSQSDILDSIAELADPDLLLRVELQGAAAFLLPREQLSSRLADKFYYLELVDDTLYLADELLERWASESTIRGLFVQRLWQQMREAETEQERQTAQLALRYGMASLLRGGE